MTVNEQGLRGLVRGWVPTAVGYSVQGALKFGGDPWPLSDQHCARCLGWISLKLLLRCSTVTR